MYKVLIVEDDAVMLRGLKDNFAAQGYLVRTAGDGESGLDQALADEPDLMILDIMLPGLNGYEICRELRREGRKIPTIMLTAKSEESDILLGLGLCADDFLTKPFRIRELLARAVAVLRRSGSEGGSGEPTEKRFGRFVLDTRARELRDLDRDGAVVPLSPKEYALLDYLLDRPGRALSREQIMNGVWGYGSLVTFRSIDRFVTGLRKKIESDAKRPRHIVTVREFGYKFEV